MSSGSHAMHAGTLDGSQDYEARDNVSSSTLSRASSSENSQGATVLEERPLPIYASIALASLVGAAIRLGLVQLRPASDTATWAVLAIVLYPQFVGCLSMGWIVSGKLWLQQMSLPLYIALASGLCGSITSFSGYIFNSSRVLIGLDFGSQDKFNGYNILMFVTIMITTLSISIVGFQIGRWVSHHSSISFPVPHPDFAQQAMQVKISRSSWLSKRLAISERIVIVFASIVLLTLIVCACVFTSFSNWDWLLTMCLAPLGAWCRYTLSALNDSKLATSVDGKPSNSKKYLPWGTLLANIIGTLIFCVVYLLQNQLSHASMHTRIVCTISSAILDGFCGCLTTVSTLVAEIMVLPTKLSIQYTLMSCASCTLIALLINGVGYWAGALTYSSCGSAMII